MRFPWRYVNARTVPGATTDRRREFTENFEGGQDVPHGRAIMTSQKLRGAYGPAWITSASAWTLDVSR